MQVHTLKYTSQEIAGNHKKKYKHLAKGEKEGDLTQTYDKNPYTNRKFKNQWTTQKCHKNFRFHNDCGPTYM